MQDTENATLITVLGVWGWKMQPVLLFLGSGAGKCNPYCCFGVLGLENATPIAVFEVLGLENATRIAVLGPWGWKMQPLLLFWGFLCFGLIAAYSGL